MCRDVSFILQNLHTTARGVVRIARNMNFGPKTDVVAWCTAQIASPDTQITRQGKNWYIRTPDCVITINASSHTIITAHRISHL